MDIICDTHIWYNIGRGDIDPSVVDANDRLIANYNNIDELVCTRNLIDFPDDTRKAIQSVFHHSVNHTIFDSPLIHIKKLYEPEFYIDLTDHIDPMRQFFEKIAQGEKVEPSKEIEYLKMCDDRKERFQKAADVMNIEADKIRIANKNKKLTKREDRIPQTRELIRTFVSFQSNDYGLPENFDWSNVELFENVLLDFYINLEKGAMIIKPNDWYDLFLLAYVQPGKQVWTREKKWIKLIDNAGMNKYRYDK